VTSDRGAFLRGRYSGGVTRLTAWFLDLALSALTLAAVVTAFTVVIDLITGAKVEIGTPSAVGVPLTTIWLALYLFVSWGGPGRTPGMAFLGLRLVRGDGSELRWGHAAIRIVVFPISFIAGIGLYGIVLGRRHRALHDLAADTVMVFDW
jgi:uncharacterized RDD family membrane protein YckC